MISPNPLTQVHVQNIVVYDPQMNHTHVDTQYAHLHEFKGRVMKSMGWFCVSPGIIFCMRIVLNYLLIRHNN